MRLYHKYDVINKLIINFAIEKKGGDYVYVHN